MVRQFHYSRLSFSDINECTNGDNECDKNHASCDNTVGSYTCSCDGGYMTTNNGRTCVGELQTSLLVATYVNKSDSHVRVFSPVK